MRILETVNWTYLLTKRFIHGLLLTSYKYTCYGTAYTHHWRTTKKTTRNRKSNKSLTTMTRLENTLLAGQASSLRITLGNPRKTSPMKRNKPMNSGPIREIWSRWWRPAGWHGQNTPNTYDRCQLATLCRAYRQTISFLPTTAAPRKNYLSSREKCK